MPITPRQRLSLVAVLLASAIGCGGPNKANVELRKQNQHLHEELKVLKQQNEGNLATIAANSGSRGVNSLTGEQLSELFTVTKIDIASLSAIREGGLKIYVTPRDADGDTIKSAGAIIVEAFDLSHGDKPQIGHWEFPAQGAGKNWYESWIVRGYALECPLSTPSATAEVTIRVTFTDTLTHRVLTAQKVITAPPATQPSAK